MEESIIQKMEKDISELNQGQNKLKTDVAVIYEKVDNTNSLLSEYVKRKDDTDADQYYRIEQLEKDKVNKDDLTYMASLIKWMIATVIGALTTVVTTVATYFKQ